jgi:methionine-rich copper-binding protein CopC
MHNHRRSVRTALAAFGAFCVVLLALPLSASAHDELVASNPKDGATLTAVPQTVLLTFEEPPAPGYTKVSVTGPSGAVVSKGAPISDGSKISIAMGDVHASGAYVVHWSLLSDDGHPVAGTVRFTVHAASTPKPLAASPAAAEKTTKTAAAKKGGSDEWIVVALGGVGALVVLFGASRLIGDRGNRRAAD